jgi:isopentenyl-diphosphate delta-isomerase type 1
MSELFTVVDDNDKVLKAEERSIVHSSEARHRAVNILVFNSKGEMLIQKRSAIKDKYPNTYDISAAGHVNFGEEYETAARREMKEELGIEDAKIEQISYFRTNFHNDNEIAKLYKCIYDGKLKANEEVSGLRFFKLQELKEMLKKKPESFAPWGAEILKWYFGLENKLDVITVKR